jgi:two-component system, LytTR family, sensor kinase
MTGKNSETKKLNAKDIKQMKFKTRKTNNWKIAILFTALLSVFNLPNNSQYYTETNFISVFISLIVTFTFLLISWHIISYLLAFEEKTKLKISNLNKILILVISIGLLLCLFFFVGIYYRNEINDLLPRKENARLFITLRGVISVFFIYIFQYALNTETKTQDIFLKNQILKTENIRAKFEMLRQQVNPHFLFNSLSALRAMIRSNSKNSEIYVLKLSEFYRQILLKKEKELIPLKEELEFINDYMFLLYARFEKMLSINIDIPERFLNLKILTFSLQILLENCIKHNIISQDKPLKINIFYTKPDSLIIENNLQAKLSQSEPSGFGLQNLEQRYNLLGVTEGIHVFYDESAFRVKIKLLNV